MVQTQNMVRNLVNSFKHMPMEDRVLQITKGVEENVRVAMPTEFNHCSSGVLVATMGLLTGIDLPNVDLIICLGLPAYVKKGAKQRKLNEPSFEAILGRTGRLGQV